jgi:predicted PurR-regulated permease PerM
VVAASVVVLLSAIGYRLVGLELWLVVALIAGVLNFIPFVGPGLTGLIALGLALVQGEIRTIIGIMVVASVVQQLDNHIVSPLVLRATVKLHPSLIILSLLVGGSLGGFIGLLVAVPLLAATKVLISHFWKTRVLGEPWREAAETIVEEQPAHPTTEILVEKIRARLDRETDGSGDPADPVEVTTE